MVSALGRDTSRELRVSFTTGIFRRVCALFTRSLKNSRFGDKKSPQLNFLAPNDDRTHFQSQNFPIFSIPVFISHGKGMTEAQCALVDLEPPPDIRRCAIPGHEPCVAKTFPATTSGRRAFQKETAFMKNLGSKYVVNVIDTIATEKQLVIIMEDCGATLLDIVTTRGALSAGQMREVTQQLFMAVAFLHINHIFHGDLKLDNVAISNAGYVKLIDFGLSDIIKENQTSRHICGSPNYTSPKVLLRTPHDLKADIWALGITTYAMATAKFPFPAFPEHLHRSRILSGPPDMHELRNTHGDDLADLTVSMLTVNPDKRPTIRECLAYKWFQEDNR
jgi:serine/threonine protein kinase